MISYDLMITSQNEAKYKLILEKGANNMTDDDWMFAMQYQAAVYCKELENNFKEWMNGNQYKYN